MDKAKYINSIKSYENTETQKIIGKIDTNLLEEESDNCLFYAFPLIERMVLEIFKLIPESEVEVREQGTMRTIISIVNQDNVKNILLPHIVDIINKLYGEDGPRNKLFHLRGKIKYDFGEDILILIVNLLMVLRNKIEEYDEDVNFEDIKMLE